MALGHVVHFCSSFLCIHLAQRLHNPIRLTAKDIGFILLLLTYIMLVQAVDSWERLYKMLRFFLISVLLLNGVALFAFSAE